MNKVPIGFIQISQQQALSSSDFQSFAPLGLIFMRFGSNLKGLYQRLTAMSTKLFDGFMNGIKRTFPRHLPYTKPIFL
jgi:hypothetical protein